MRNCSQKVSMFLACFALATIANAVQESKTESQVETKTVKIPAGVRYEFSRTVRPGGLVKAQDGREGTIKRVFRITYKDGKPVDKELLKEERSNPEPTLFLMSRRGFNTSRGAFHRGKVLTMSATAYDPSPATIGPGATGRTRMGYRATYGHVAVDPRVIRLGSLVYVEGYGLAIASDTGGAIKGKKIDLCYDSRSTAMRFGRKKVRVHVLRPG